MHQGCYGHVRQESHLEQAAAEGSKRVTHWPLDESQFGTEYCGTLFREVQSRKLSTLPLELGANLKVRSDLCMAVQKSVQTCAAVT